VIEIRKSLARAITTRLMLLERSFSVKNSHGNWINWSFFP